MERTIGEESGVQFSVAAPDSSLERAYRTAVAKLADCLAPDGAEGRPVLQEGGVYRGCWLESTGTINAEILSRFAPSVSRATFEMFADHARADGLLPYKVAEGRPAFRQIQLVTPPARSVWTHYVLTGRRDRDFLAKMYAALSRFDEWLAQHRDTRGTGCVEAFCTFDTGHDLSPRFWHMPDTPHEDDPAQYDPDSPLLPLLAPDLTASVYASRLYLAQMAAELDEGGGGDGRATAWKSKAARTLQSLITHCFEEQDGFFYDVDRSGRFIRIQSDVLMRVLACEIGDGDFFASSLSRYLLNTRKFFSRYPFTSIAMDDPRFDPFSHYNTWGGAVNFLSLIRAPHAFERHGRYVELTWVMQPIVSALSRMTRFGQCLSPWTGEEGYTESYSPTLLCLLDFVERLSGIQPTIEGKLRFTGLLPKTLDHGRHLADETSYRRTVDGVVYELHNTRRDCTVYRDGELLLRFPYGVRVLTDRRGALLSVVGMTARTVQGTLRLADGRDIPFRAAGNERLLFADGALRPVQSPGVVYPTYI